MSDFGILALLPPIVAIVLAIVTKRVLFALFAGVWVGGVMVAGGNPITGTVKTWEWIVGNAIDDWNQKILLYDFLIGAATGLIYKSGAANAFVRAVTKKINNSRRASLLGWLLGVIIFFDDYANTVVVGNTMRPITDRTRVSREMLAYIDDSTAAPVAGLALISSWIGYEIGLIGDSFDRLGITLGAYAAWLSSVPYRFYSILAIILVFIVALTHRHYGPMLKAEYRARTTGKVIRDGATPMMATESDLGLPKEKGGTIHGFIWPIITLIVVFFIGMWYTGGGSEVYAKEGLKGVMSNADSALSLLWAGFAMLVVITVIILAKRQMTLEELEKNIVQGMKQMLMANAILLLAWSIGTACDAVGTAEFVVHAAIRGGVPGGVIPLIIFLVSMFIAWTTGTSWGTFAIVMPMAIPLGYHLGGIGPILYASIASVFAGGIFGDHCSPISDTTIMSSMFSGCDHIDHVNTQIPYALTAAGVGIVLLALFAIGIRNWAILLPLGIVLLVILHRILSEWYGKRVGIPHGKVPVYRVEE